MTGETLDISGLRRPPPPLPTDQSVLTSALAEYGAAVQVLERHEGPRTRTYRVVPAPRVSVGRIQKAMQDVQVRIGAPSCVAREEGGMLFVEVGREDPVIPRLRDLPRSPDPRDILVGVDNRGDLVTVRPEHLVHCAVASSSGGGKTTALQVIIDGFRRIPQSTVVACDPKRSGRLGVTDWDAGVVVVSEPGEISTWIALVEELRATRAPNWKGVRSERAAAFSPGPVLLVIDELQAIVSDMMTQMNLFCLLSMGREVGVHCLLATQNLGVSIIPNSLRTNCPTRLVLQTASASDSRVALGEGGAEKLLGRGDALLKYGGKTRRVQIPSVD